MFSSQVTYPAYALHSLLLLHIIQNSPPYWVAEHNSTPNWVALRRTHHIGWLNTIAHQIGWLLQKNSSFSSNILWHTLGDFNYCSLVDIVVSEGKWCMFQHNIIIEEKAKNFLMKNPSSTLKLEHLLFYITQSSEQYKDGQGT